METCASRAVKTTPRATRPTSRARTAGTRSASTSGREGSAGVEAVATDPPGMSKRQVLRGVCRTGPEAPRGGWASDRREGAGRVVRPAVLHAAGRHLQVAPQRRVLLGGEVEGVDGVAHVRQPRVALLRADRERRVPHPQPGVPALLGVGGRAAPVLLEEG